MPVHAGNGLTGSRWRDCKMRCAWEERGLSERSQATMRSPQLQTALAEHVEAVAVALHADVANGAEVPFELERQSRRRGSIGPSLFCYRALTGDFIVERRTQLERLPSHAAATRLLESFAGLERYLASAGIDATRLDDRTRARTAIGLLLEDVFEEQSDFELRPERVRGALERLEDSELAASAQTTIVATLHGLTIGSPELAVTAGLMIARPEVLEGLPDGAIADDEVGSGDHLVVALAAGEDDSREAIARGREVLSDLLRALRLFGDGRVTLGSLAWARVGRGKWNALALGAGGRPHGMLVVSPEQEDELRAFCSLVSRRAPRGDELAWALTRFELGCERERPFEGLSDHLLALRALLEPEGPSSGLLPGRLAALCATPELRGELTERIVQASALERDVILGSAPPKTATEALARDVADHLRALLRDVICGHLDANLVAIADELLLSCAGEERGQTPADDQASAGEASLEEMLGDAGQGQEILDVFI
jgi:hypothetical protein